MLTPEPKIIKPIELMLEGETGFTGAPALLFDKRGIPYLSVNLPFKDHVDPQAGFIIRIERTGQGYGKYNIDGKLSAHEYMVQDIPFFDSSNGSFNIFWVPLGYTGTKEEYIKEFFPPAVLQVFQSIKAVQNDLEEKVSRSPRIANKKRFLRYNVDLDICANSQIYPKTAEERQRLIKDMKRGDYSRLFQYAEYFEELGEPLSDSQLDIITRIVDNENREKSS